MLDVQEMEYISPVNSVTSILEDYAIDYRTKRPKIGSIWGINAKAIPDYNKTQNKNALHIYSKTWDNFLKIKPFKGMYIGYRYKQNGFITYSHESSHLECKSTTEVWLFIKNDRTNPIPVYPWMAHDCNT